MREHGGSLRLGRRRAVPERLGRGIAVGQSRVTVALGGRLDISARSTTNKHQAPFSTSVDPAVRTHLGIYVVSVDDGQGHARDLPPVEPLPDKVAKLVGERVPAGDGHEGRLLGRCRRQECERRGGDGIPRLEPDHFVHVCREE